MRNNVGKWAEEIVSQWLIVKRWNILHQRWHCRFGEIDIIARSKSEDTIIFVEVKSRGNNNWDQYGLLSVNEKKQTKLTLAAEMFLAKFPEYANYNCRFDVALLKHRPAKSVGEENRLTVKSQLQKPIYYNGYQFKIVSYLINAF